MPRRARLAIAGVPWHIIQRGNNRSACFYAEDDYRVYFDTLLEQSVRWRCAIHAYVLMTNHVHLLLTPETCDGPAGLMKNLGQRYVQYVNRTYRRTGTLWEGRYRSCLAQSGNYVLTCSRYIELNPVRAAMVRDPAAYRWSSYRTNAMGHHSSLLQPHQDWLALGGNGLGARNRLSGTIRRFTQTYAVGRNPNSNQWRLRTWQPAICRGNRNHAQA